MSEREQRIETVLRITHTPAKVTEHELPWKRRQAERIVDALASQPVVERQITEEMVEVGTRASWHGPPSYDELPPSIRDGRARMVRDILEAALDDPSQETGELT